MSDHVVSNGERSSQMVSGTMKDWNVPNRDIPDQKVFDHTDDR